MSNLRTENIVKGEDGENWIRPKRQKTDKALSVPLLPVAQKIIDKYNGIVTEGKVLLSKTNAHFNAYLKEILLPRYPYGIIFISQLLDMLFISRNSLFLHL